MPRKSWYSKKPPEEQKRILADGAKDNKLRRAKKRLGDGDPLIVQAQIESDRKKTAELELKKSKVDVEKAKLDNKRAALDIKRAQTDIKKMAVAHADTQVKEQRKINGQQCKAAKGARKTATAVVKSVVKSLPGGKKLFRDCDDKESRNDEEERVVENESVAREAEVCEIEVCEPDACEESRNDEKDCVAEEDSAAREPEFCEPAVCETGVEDSKVGEIKVDGSKRDIKDEDEEALGDDHPDFEIVEYHGRNEQSKLYLCCENLGWKHGVMIRMPLTKGVLYVEIDMDDDFSCSGAMAKLMQQAFEVHLPIEPEKGLGPVIGKLRKDLDPWIYDELQYVRKGRVYMQHERWAYTFSFEFRDFKKRATRLLQIMCPNWEVGNSNDAKNRRIQSLEYQNGEYRARLALYDEIFAENVSQSANKRNRDELERDEDSSLEEGMIVEEDRKVASKRPRHDVR